MKKIYTGKVDVVDEQNFLVTIKGDDGNPRQFSFPTEMSEGLEPFDYVHYIIDEECHYFEKATVSLTQEEAESIKAMVDELLPDEIFKDENIS